MNLIIQAVHDIPAELLQRIAGLATATKIEQKASHAYRLC